MKIVNKILLVLAVLLSLSNAATAMEEGLSLEEQFQQEHGSSTEPVFANVFVNAGGSLHFLTDEEEAHCHYEGAPSNTVVYSNDPETIRRMVQEGFFDNVGDFQGENGLNDFTGDERYVFAYFGDESTAENQYKTAEGRRYMNWLIYSIADANGVDLPKPDATEEEIKGTTMEKIKSMTLDCYRYNFLSGEKGPLFVVYDLGPQ